MNKGVLTFKHGRQLVNSWSDDSLPRRRLVGRLPLRLWWSSSRQIKMPKPCHITSETTATDDLSALVFKWVVFFSCLLHDTEIRNRERPGAGEAEATTKQTTADSTGENSSSRRPPPRGRRQDIRKSTTIIIRHPIGGFPIISPTPMESVISLPISSSFPLVTEQITRWNPSKLLSNRQFLQHFHLPLGLV